MHWIDWLLLIWLGWYAWEGYRSGAAAWQQLAIMVLAMAGAGLVWKSLLAVPLMNWSPLVKLSLLLLLFLLFTLALGLLLEYLRRKRTERNNESRPGLKGLGAGIMKWVVLLIIFLLLTRMLDSDNQLYLLLSRSFLLRVLDWPAALIAPWLGLPTIA